MSTKFIIGFALAVVILVVAQLTADKIESGWTNKQTA